MRELLRGENQWRLEFAGEAPASLAGRVSALPVTSTPDEAAGSGEYRELRTAGEDLQACIDELRSAGARITRVEPVYGRLEDVFLSATAGQREEEPERDQ